MASLINPYRSTGGSDDEDDLEDLPLPSTAARPSLPVSQPPPASANKSADPAAFLGPSGVAMAVTTGENQTHKQ